MLALLLAMTVFLVLFDSIRLFGYSISFQTKRFQSNARHAAIDAFAAYVIW